MSRSAFQIGCILLAMVLLARGAQSQPGKPTVSAAGPVRLDLRTNSFIDLHFFVRAQVGAPPYSRGEAFAEGDAADALNAATDAAAQLESELGGERGWGLIEPLLASCTSSADAVETCARLPESFTPASGGEVRLRDGAVRLAAAYEALEPVFLLAVWPRHREQVEQARLQLAHNVVAKQDECYEFVTTSLGMTMTDLVIPVYLVAESPPPGGFTHRQRAGGGVCFIGVEHATSSLLNEVVLHESIHALDLATQSQDTALQTLRHKLVENGVTRSDAAWRDLPHTLMFVQAGETVRRVLDGTHLDYGDAAGYYEKVPDATACVRPAWRRRLDGAMTLREAIDEMIRAFEARREPAQP